MTLESELCPYVDFPGKLLFNVFLVREKITVETTAEAAIQCFIQFNHDYSFHADMR